MIDKPISIPLFQQLYAQCKTKGQALGLCNTVLSQHGYWSDIDPDVRTKLVLPHREAFEKLMEKLNEGAGK